MTADIVIRMTRTVTPDLIFLARPGVVLYAGETYPAEANKHGAVSGICSNGQRLGVRPGEFVFLKAPDWLRGIWKENYPPALRELEG